MTNEERCRTLARRFTYRSNPASMSMARSLVTFAKRADVDPGFDMGTVATLVNHLRDCGPVEDGLDPIRARMWERRAAAS
ncbi:MAG: hypothetical protein JJT89_00495 [Nitriliruptoraceae bacterium]|nr:hypothetical protein [Nitriliruptoraceae bacterium]